VTEAQLKEIVKSDIIDGRFLVTGNLTPSSKEDCDLEQEIDTYEMDKWVKRTQKTFL
jgi:hypothetical protein